MSFTVTSYPDGTFSWADVYSTDIASTKTFMTSLLGWTSKDMPTEEGKPDYTMFFKDQHVVAGGSPTYMDGMPSFWSNYISVSDLDAMVAKAEKLGAKITMPAMDVLDAGRMAVITDPTGAAVSLWQPNKHIGADLVNTVGAMAWNDLITPDLEKAQSFYADLFGWTYEDAGGGYQVIKNNGRMNGGMMEMTKEMGDMPPAWNVYFTVASIDDSIAKLTEMGGSVLMEPSKGDHGTIAVVADPTGAAFSIIEMAVPPDEWEE